MAIPATTPISFDPVDTFMMTTIKKKDKIISNIKTLSAESPGTVAPSV